MFWLLWTGSVVFTVGVLSGQTTVPLNGIGKNVLTNQGVAMLARAGYSEGFIIDMIHQKQTQFDVSTDGLVFLAKEGLSERIVRTMVANVRKQEIPAIAPAVIRFSPVSSPGVTQPQSKIFLEVSFATPAASNSSGSVKGSDWDRWFMVPNLPALRVNAR
jgi:hypothetical protein